MSKTSQIDKAIASIDHEIKILEAAKAVLWVHLKPGSKAKSRPRAVPEKTEKTA